MRSIRSSLLSLIVAGCGPASTLSDVAPEPVVMPPSLVWRYPMQPVSSYEVASVGVVRGLGAEGAAGFHFGLHADYPTEIVLQPGKDIAIKGCGSTRGSVTRWSGVGLVWGDAAAVSFVDGRIHLSLQRAGRLQFQLDGSIDGMLCPGSVDPVSMRLKQIVSVQVTPISAFTLVSYGPIGACGERPVIPNSAPVGMPMVWAVSDTAEQFLPENAVPAATLVVTSATGLKTTPIETYLEFAPGPVELAVETSLPTSGLRGFEVVDQSVVTTMDARLVLHIAASKGSVPTPLTEGADVSLFRREGSVVRLEETGPTMTSRGRLCGPPPPHWFETTSSTPEVCSPERPTELEGPVTVSLRRPGTCAFETRIAGGSVRWKASFTATVR